MKQGLQFLFTEVQSGLTFAGLAQSFTSKDPDRRRRNIHDAHVAYQTVRKFQNRVEMSELARLELNKQIGRLESILQKLGEA